MILTKYILKEHVAPFLFSLILIIFVFLLNIIFRDLGRILSRGIELVIIIEFLFLNLAWIIALAIPMAVLITSLSSFGRFSADNEVTAIKAGGISFYRLLLPVLIVSVIMTFGLIIYNNKVLPHFNHRARLLMEDIFRKRPTLKLEPNVVFTDIPKMNLLAKSIIEEGDSSRLENITIDDFNDKDIRRTIFAEWGKLKFATGSDKLFLDLYDGEIHEMNIEEYSKYRKFIFERYRINVKIPGMSLKRSESEYRGDREKSIEVMRGDIVKYKSSIEKRQKNIQQLIERHMRDTFSLGLVEKVELFNALPGEVVVDSYEPTEAQLQWITRKIANIRNQLETEEKVKKSYYRSIDKLLVEIHKKYSIPVACIVFVLIGAPLGILTKKGNMGVAAAVGFLFFLLYWVFLIGGEELGDRQIISPAWGMWAPNILVGCFGIYLVVLTGNEYHPIQWQKIKMKLFKRTGNYE